MGRPACAVKGTRMRHDPLFRRAYRLTAAISAALAILTATACGDGRGDGDSSGDGNGDSDGDGDGRGGDGDTNLASQALGALPANALDPADNPRTEAKVELGRLLFWDPVLSGDRDVACATCHHPDFAYADGRAMSVGVAGKGLGPARRPSPGTAHVTPRSSMTVLNSAFAGISPSGVLPDPREAPMFWDNRARSLETQAKGPIAHLDEMRGLAFDERTILAEVEARLEAIPEYRARFTASFGAGPIAVDDVARAISAFERTLVDHDSSFDRFARGDTSAMNDSQRRGLAVLRSHGCTNCHSGPMFSDYALHRLGVPDLRGAPRDPGAGGDRFRTPTLRNVSRTGPYMHNGSLGTLEDVFRFYDRVNRRLDPALEGVRGPQRGEVDDLRAFLGALSDGTFDRTIPESLPSGLEPGGSLR